MILAAAWASAFTYQFWEVLNNPRLTRLPDDFHSEGFSPCFGRLSPSKNDAADVLASSVSTNRILYCSQSWEIRSLSLAVGTWTIFWFFLPKLISCLLGSREAIKPRPSLLELDVPVSVHPAPDILSLRFCSCVCNHGNFHVLPQGCYASNYHDFRLHGVDVLFRPRRILICRSHMNGFAFWGL